MAENNDVLINAEFRVNKQELEKVIGGLSEGITKALSSSLSASVKKFATDLGKSIQVSFNDTVIGELKKPIKIQIDTRDAKKKINTLVESLSKVVGQLDIATKTEKKTSTGSTKTTPTKTTGTKSTPTVDSTDKDIATQANDVAKYTLLLGQLKNQAASFGASGQGMVKSLNDIETSLLSVGKASEDGIFSPAQISALGKLGNKISDIQNKIDDFNSSIKEISTIASSGKSPTSQLEKGLELTNKGLVQYGFNQKSVDAITKKVAAGVSYLKEQYNLLFDEVKKGDQADLGRILLTKKRIDNAEALAASRLTSIQRNRGNIIEPVSDKQVEELLKNEQQLRDKARKAEIQGEKESAKIKKELDKDYTDTWKRLLKEREKEQKDEDARSEYLADLAVKRETARQKSANARNLDDIKTREKILEDVKKKEEQAASVRQKRKEIEDLKSTKLNRGNLESIAENLRKKRSDISVAEDIPINVLNKQTRQYDSTIVRLEVDLENLNKEYKAGNITVEEASRRYKKLNDDVKKLQIGIASIDASRLAKEFNQEEADPRRLSYRLGILAFTLNSVGASLTNFSRNFFQVFDQLGQAAEPIERLTNNLALQVKQQKISESQQTTILSRLREIGDLPGSSVESANETFNALQKINISLQERLDLTEGIAKLSAAPGGTKESAKQLSDTLAAISLEKVVDEDRFKTIRKSGGVAVSDLINRLGFSGGRDIEKFGIANFIKEVGTELKLLEVPASTTSDRINRLKSRLSEIGVLFGKIVAPGLEQLNLLLRDEIVPAFDQLIKKFNSLSDSTKNTIGGLIIGLPVLAGLAGGFISLVGAIGFAVSGVTQIIGLLKFIPGILAKILPAAAAGTATGAPIAGFIGPQLIQVGLLTRAGIALGNVFKALTGPIGIAIQLILSLFTSLYKNTDGIRDRLVFAFTRVDQSVRDLLISLGLGDVGLLGILDAVFSVITEIGNFIGGVLISALTALAANFANIIDNLREMIDLFKSGDVLGGLLSFGKLVLNALGGLIKTIVTEVVAFAIESIARALENTIGGGLLSGAFRQGADSLRRSNGTDNESVARRNAELGIQQQRLDFEQQIADVRKESVDAAKRTEEETAELLKNNIGEINTLIEKSKDEFEKFKTQQITNQIKEVQDAIKSNTSQTVNLFRDLTQETTDANKIAKAYDKTIQDLARNQANLARSQNKIGLLNALSEFKVLVSRRGELKKIYESAERGQIEFTLLADALDRAGKSGNLSELKANLAEIQNLGRAVNLAGLDTDLPVVFDNIVEKTKISISEISRESSKSVLEYQETLKELEKLERKRQEALTLERKNIDFEAETRKIELDSRIRDIQIEKESLILERRESFKAKQLEREAALDAEKRINENRNRKRELANQRDILPVDDTLGRERINREIEDLEVAYQKITQATRELTTEKRYSLFLENVKELSSVFRDISKTISEISQPVLNSISKLFDSKKGDTSALFSIGDLVKSSKLSKDSEFFKVYISVLSQLEEGAIDTTKAITLLLEELAKSQNIDLISSVRDAQEKYANRAKDFNSGVPEKNLNVQGLDRKSLEEFLVRLTSSEGGLLDKINAGKATVISSDVQEKINNLVNFKAELLGSEILKLIQDLSIKTDQGSTESLNQFIDYLFSNNELKFKDYGVELITAAITYFEEQRKLDAAIIESNIKNKISLVDSKAETEKTKSESKIKELEAQFTSLDILIKQSQGKERRDLVRQQNEIRRILIDENYKKLDLEQAFIIQKAILDANGNIDEIARIQKQGKIVRDQLALERQLQLKEAIEAGQINLNQKGQIVDLNNNVVKPVGPAQVPTIVTDDLSGVQTNATGGKAGEEERVSLTDRLANGLSKINEQLDTTRNKALETGRSFLSLWDSIASGDLIMARFQELLGGAALNAEMFGAIMLDIGATVATVVAQGIGKVIADALVNGVDSLSDFGKVIGDMLIQIGILLVQSGIAAMVLGGIGTFVPALRPLFGGPETFVAGAIATAAGAGMILLGKALGGGQTANVSNTGTTASANSSAGNTGQVDYDPEKDPKLIYQKALRAQVYIDIKRDDGSIVKAVVKQVNRNPAFANLIGNQRTGFVL